MNCKRGDLAQIKVPAAFAAHGIEQLHNRVVETVALMDWTKEPTWSVKPSHVIQVHGGAVLDARRTRAEPGQLFHVDSIPDSWLVPMRGTAGNNQVDRRTAVPA